MLQAGVMVSVRRCMVRSLCGNKMLKVPMGDAQVQVGVNGNLTGTVFASCMVTGWHNC